MQTGRGMIFDERGRQEEKEGYDYRHDAQHTHGELVDAAIAYLIHDQDYLLHLPEFWPWDKSAFKPKDLISNLVRAGALIAAEIDRLQCTLTVANNASTRPASAVGTNGDSNVSAGG